MTTLQLMLMRADGDRILLLPAWPREWNVRFRLHAPKRTVVEGEYRDVKLDVRVTPPSRAKDVVRMTRRRGTSRARPAGAA